MPENGAWQAAFGQIPANKLVVAQTDPGNEIIYYY
jgi:hypothetical protein